MFLLVVLRLLLQFILGYVVLDSVYSVPQGRSIQSQPNHQDIFKSEYRKSCKANDVGGVCMYQAECYYTGGRPVGICQHGFQFGACCNHDAFNNEVTTTSTLAPPTTKATSSDVIDSHTTSKCGIQSKIASPKGRVVNGTQTLLGEIPWQVSILLYRGIQTGFEHHCGGALLNDKWIVTAAHCVQRKLLAEMLVRIGEYDMKFEDKKYPSKDIKILRKITHPDYNSNSDYFSLTYENDLALLELKEPVKFKRHITPICLPGTEDLLTGRYATVTGWGKMKEDGDISRILQKVNVPVLSNKECEEMYARAGSNQSIPDIFLCAGYKDGGSDACNGDSGGPLQVQTKDGRYILSGIVSWGNGCGESNKPGVYTRVSKYVPWILSNIAPNTK